MIRKASHNEALISCFSDRGSICGCAKRKREKMHEIGKKSAVLIRCAIGFEMQTRWLGDAKAAENLESGSTNRFLLASMNSSNSNSNSNAIQKVVRKMVLGSLVRWGRTLWSSESKVCYLIS